MRIAILVLVLGARAAGANPWKGMPKGAATVAKAVNAAIVAGDRDAFVALLPPELVIDGRKDGSLAVQVEINAATSLARWAPVDAKWRVRRHGKRWRMVATGDSGAKLTIGLGRVDGAWQVVELDNEPGDQLGCGACATRGDLPPPPPLSFGAPTVSGRLGAAVVQRVVRRQLQALTTCFTAAAKVTATFAIAGDGKVVSSQASGAEDAVDNCVAAAISAIAFPTAKDGTRVTYPLDYEPSK